MQLFNTEIIKQAVKEAQKTARQIPIGSVVAHPSYELACELIAIKGDIAVCEVNNEYFEFPLDEIFDCNFAYKIALRIQNQLN